MTRKKIVEVWQVRAREDRHNPCMLLVSARRGARGPWLTLKKIPKHVREYMLVDEKGVIDVDAWISADVMREDLRRSSDPTNPTTVQRSPKNEILCLVRIERTVQLKGKRWGGLKSVKDLADYLGASDTTKDSLSHRVYKDTTCGAWLEFIPHDAPANKAEGVVVGSIVEGTDACVDPEELYFPFTKKRWNETIQSIERAAMDIWNDTHGCEKCYDSGEAGGQIDPDCKACNGEGVVI